MKSDLLTKLDASLDEAGIPWRPKGRAEAEVPPYYYDGKLYRYADEDGNFHSMDEKSLRRRLLSTGFFDTIDDGKRSVDRFITMIQDRHAIRYSGPVAGYSVGIHPLPGGGKMLVTQSSVPVLPVQGEWPLLKGIINTMFVSGDCDQRPYIFGWLKVFAGAYFTTLSKGAKAVVLPGQALAMAGAADCGKSLIKQIVISLFGGRSAFPFQYMISQTGFNGELAEAPILEIDDQAASKDPRDRNLLGARIKEMTVAGALRIHAKYQTAISLKPCCRMIFCVNDEPASLMVLPPLEAGLVDKLMLFKVETAIIPMPTGSDEERDLFWNSLVKEFPAFMHFLLYEFVIPRELASKRFGVRHFHHPEIVAALEEYSPEVRMLEIIDDLYQMKQFSVAGVEELPLIDISGSKAMRKGKSVPLTDEEVYRLEHAFDPWVGSASEFEIIIRSRVQRYEAERFFKYSTSSGMLLQSISRRHPDRVVRRSTVRGQTRWMISPPSVPANWTPEPEPATDGVTSEPIDLKQMIAEFTAKLNTGPLTELEPDAESEPESADAQ